MNFFIDTNIVLDVVSLREPFGEIATLLFNFADRGKIKLFTSSNTIVTTHYILRKAFSEERVRNAIDDVLKIVEIIPVEKKMLKKGLQSSYKDFEDAVQIFCAHEIINLEGIITRDLKHFQGCGLQIYSPDEALYFIKEKLKN